VADSVAPDNARDAGTHPGASPGVCGVPLRPSLRGTGRADAYQHGSLYADGIANPLALLRGQWETYTSASLQTSFVFYDGRLCAVAVEFTDERPLPQLEKTYGARRPFGFVHLGANSDLRAWVPDADRVIVHIIYLERDLSRSGIETVTYLDRHLYEPVAARLVQQHQATTTRNLQRLD